MNRISKKLYARLVSFKVCFLPAEVVTAAKSAFILTDKPEEVRFLPVNATAVRISWSGSAHLPTSIIYTVYCSTIIMRQYERVYSHKLDFC